MATTGAAPYSTGARVVASGALLAAYAALVVGAYWIIRQTFERADEAQRARSTVKDTRPKFDIPYKAPPPPDRVYAEATNGQYYTGSAILNLRGPTTFDNPTGQIVGQQQVANFLAERRVELAAILGLPSLFDLAHGDEYIADVDPIKGGISQQLVASALCPSGIGEIDSLISGQRLQCSVPCPPGFETRWYEPKKADGSPLTRQVPVLDKDGNPRKIKDKDGKEVDETMQEEIQPEPWCRAQCPPATYSTNEGKWLPGDTSAKPSIALLSSDAATAKDDNGNLVRTDAGNDGEACKSSLYVRKLLRGGANFACGWCTQPIPDQGTSFTSVLKHNCDSDGLHYGIDFTDYCMRGKTIPVFIMQTIDAKSAKENDTNVSFCTTPYGKLGGKKTSGYLVGPSGCKNGDLLPVLPMAFKLGKDVGTVPSAKSFVNADAMIVSGASDFRADQQLVSSNGVNYSAFITSCYTSCPPWMVPFGNVEDHMCKESCPPNTRYVQDVGRDDLCMKEAFVKKIIIPDMFSAVQSMINLMVEQTPPEYKQVQ